MFGLWFILNAYLDVYILLSIYKELNILNLQQSNKAGMLLSTLLYVKNWHRFTISKIETPFCFNAIKTCAVLQNIKYEIINEVQHCITNTRVRMCYDTFLVVGNLNFVTLVMKLIFIWNKNNSLKVIPQNIRWNNLQQSPP